MIGYQPRNACCKKNGIYPDLQFWPQITCAQSLFAGSSIQEFPTFFSLNSRWLGWQRRKNARPIKQSFSVRESGILMAEEMLFKIQTRCLLCLETHVSMFSFCWMHQKERPQHRSTCSNPNLNLQSASIWPLQDLVMFLSEKRICRILQHLDPMDPWLLLDPGSQGFLGFLQIFVKDLITLSATTGAPAASRRW